MLRHLEALERILPTLEGAPMRGGVPMLHSDLVYFRQNVRGLKQILASVTKHSHRARKPR
ncbi:MAG TPA: hypothetical protein VJS68_03840 [Thermoplasmata archaeon]|nr:hypothetical protein [Thermoplasmata archaeon]